MYRAVAYLSSCHFQVIMIKEHGTPITYRFAVLHNIFSFGKGDFQCAVHADTPARDAQGRKPTAQRQLACDSAFLMTGS